MTNTNGTVVSLQERLNEPQTAAALNRLLDRIDTLEQAVTTLTNAVQQAPGMVGMVTDMADEAIQQANQSGVNVDQRLQHGLALLTQLTEPRTAAVLSKLLGRIDQLEQLVELTEQAPGMVAMVGDIVDDSYRNATTAGVDIESRAASGLQMLGKLTEPETVEVLSNLLDRTDQLKQLVDLADQAPGMVAMMGDIVDDSYRNATTAGVDIESRAASGLQILSKLTEPGTVAVLSDLLDRTDQLKQLVDLADQVPGMVAMVGDIVDDTYRKAAEAGVDIESLIRSSAGAAMKLSAITSSEEFDALIDSGVLDAKALSVVGKAASALVEAESEPPRKVGMLGLMSALNDANVQKTMGFLMNFAKNFGQAK